MVIKIKFCKCGSIMVADGRCLVCRKCGKSIKGDDELKMSVKAAKKKEIVILEKDDVALPMTDRECPNCGHMQAYYWMIQTRAADEPPTQFFRCLKCRHTWREYK
ncbi:MAG: transcription factor S [Candidatus Aenigmatarchaeota archaeon]